MGIRRGLATVVVMLLAPAIARADQELDVAVLNLHVTVPDGWTHTVTDGQDVFNAEDGRAIGQAFTVQGACYQLFQAVRDNPDNTSVGTAEAIDVAFTGLDYGPTEERFAVYCRDADVLGAGVPVVIAGEEALVAPMVRAYSAAIDRLESVGDELREDAKPVEPPPAPHPRRILPSKLEFSLYFPSHSLVDPLPCTLCFGVAAGLQRTSWHSRKLTWSYRARGALSNGGASGVAEAGIGLASPSAPWAIAVQAIAGIGSVKHVAPATPHVGGEIDLQFLSRDKYDAIGVGFEMGYSRAWRSDGVTQRFQGGFIGAGRHAALTAEFGYETWLDGEIITIVFGFVALPPIIE